MTRTTKSWAFGAAVLALAGWCGGVAFSQEKGEPKKDAGAEPASPNEEMAKLAMPNEHHQHLADFAGDWDVKGKMWEMPGMPPAPMGGTSHNHMILGGRFLVEEYDGGTFQGMPFNGFGLFGYDNLKKVHTSEWADSMGTLVMHSEGKCEGDACEKTTLVGSWTDPMGKWGWRSVTTHEKDGHFHIEAFMTAPDEAMKMAPPGSPREWKAMEMDYTKKAK
jgi:hypothetical protein